MCCPVAPSSPLSYVPFSFFSSLICTLLFLLLSHMYPSLSPPLSYVPFSFSSSLICTLLFLLLSHMYPPQSHPLLTPSIITPPLPPSINTPTIKTPPLPPLHYHPSITPPPLPLSITTLHYHTPLTLTHTLTLHMYDRSEH